MARRLDDFFEKHALALTLALISLIAAAIYWDFLIFKKVFLFTDIGSDSVNSYYPYLRRTADYIRENGLPQWSFNWGMGQCILPNSVGDPFNDILYLLGGEHLAYGLIYVECLKMLLSGLFFFLYLRTIPLRGFACILGALMYAFNGYMLAYSAGWYFFSTECVMAAALLLAFEQYFVKARWQYLPLVFAYLSAYQPFFLFTYGVLLLGYSALRLAIQGEFGLRRTAVFYARLGFLTALGAGLAAVFLISNVSLMTQSSRLAGGSEYLRRALSGRAFETVSSLELISSLCRLFSIDLLGGARDFKGWGNYLESPLLYSSLGSLVLLPQVFVLAEKRRAKVLAAACAACLFPFVFPYFRRLFWLFTVDYYRSLCLFMSIVMISLAAYSAHLLHGRRRMDPLLAIATVLALLFALYAPLGAKNELIDGTLRSSIAFLLIAYGGALVFAGTRSFDGASRALFLLVLAAELVFMGNTALRGREPIAAEDWRSRTGYNDHTVEALAFIKENDKSFFRVTKDYTSGPSSYTSFNDAIAQDFYGSVSYSSFNQRHYIGFLDSVGALDAGQEHQTRWSIGVTKRPLLQTLTAFKYRLGKNPDPKAYAVDYEPMGRFGDVRVLRKRFFLPLGVTYDKMLPAAEFAALNDYQKDLTLLKAFVPDEADRDSLKGFRRPAAKDPVELKKDALETTRFSQNRIEGRIEVGTPKVLFMAIPYDKGWRATVDGAPAKILKVDGGLMGVLLQRGEHAISFEYASVYLKESLLASALFACLYLLLVFNKKLGKNIMVG